MTLKEWQNYGWLRPHQTSPQEIQDLLKIVDRDLHVILRGGDLRVLDGQIRGLQALLSGEVEVQFEVAPEPTWQPLSIVRTIGPVPAAPPPTDPGDDGAAAPIANNVSRSNWSSSVARSWTRVRYCTRAVPAIRTKAVAAYHAVSRPASDQRT